MGNEKYVVYQYLKFIWNKKWYLVAVTLLLTVVGFFFSQRNPIVYSGQALIFTGNANNDLLSKPEFITAKYKKLLVNKSLTAKIPVDNEVILNVTDKSQQGAEQQVQKAAKKYVSDLKQKYNSQFSANQKYAKALQQRIDQIEQVTKEYNQLIRQNTNEQKLSYYTEAALQQEGYLADYKVKLHKAEYQISLMEQPRLMDVTSVPVSNNSFRNALLGGAFGFQFMLILLVIWKYILDARRSLNS